MLCYAVVLSVSQVIPGTTDRTPGPSKGCPMEIHKYTSVSLPWVKPFKGAGK